MMDDQVIDYKAKANGRFSGILRWPQFETLWEALSSGAQDWYVYAPQEGAPPGKPFSAVEMKSFLSTTEAYLRERCTPDFCGAVYADDVSDPKLCENLQSASHGRLAAWVKRLCLNGLSAAWHRCPCSTSKTYLNEYSVCRTVGLFSQTPSLLAFC